MQSQENQNQLQSLLQHPLLLIFLAITSWLSWYLFLRIGFELVPGEVVIPGQATAEGVDVGKRVGAFYKSLLLTIGATGLGLFLTRNLIQKEEIQRIRPWQVFAGIGLALLWFRLMDSPQVLTEIMLMTVAVTARVWQLTSEFLTKRADWAHFISLFIFATGLSIGIRPVFELSFHWLWLISLLIIWGLTLLITRIGLTLPHEFPRKLMPLAWIPFAVVLGRELYFFGNHKGWHALSPSFSFWFVFLFICILWFFWFAPRSRRRAMDLEGFLGRYALPGLLMGLVGLSSQWLQMGRPTDMFELANEANGIMRWFKFGEWPLFQALSSHLLSDIDSSTLYTLLHGYDGSLDFLAYDFLPKMIFVWVSFSFLRKALDQSFFPFILILLLPLLVSFIPGAMAMALVTPFLLLRLSEGITMERMVLLLSWLVFLVVWKLEVGLSAIAGSLLVLVWLVAHHFDWKKVWLILGLGIALLIDSFILFLLVEWLSDYSLADHFSQALGYFGAGQAHGYPSIGNSADAAFQFQYVLFPFILGVLLLYHFFQKPKGKIFLPLSILFLIGYYFFNAQRGLVRHGFVEGSDGFISSYFWLGIFLSLFYFLKGTWTRLLISVGALLFLLHAFKHPGTSGYKNILEQVIPRVEQWEAPKVSGEKIQRITGDQPFPKFLSFMDNNFAPEATFIDLSNNPMLYFYTQRGVPSYFNQYMQNTVTEELQQRNIALLETLDVPVVVFSKVPDNGWFDNTDGVPNPVRYEAIAHYIYAHYQPHAVLDDL
ncbi:MAG: hypothetical protein HKN16_05490, partial [Saprospiraceae bacterium]|nr:hypothetical protein [Saprospiraceae bacterium]